jgi:hypothetical protein
VTQHIYQKESTKAYPDRLFEINSFGRKKITLRWLVHEHSLKYTIAFRDD